MKKLVTLFLSVIGFIPLQAQTQEGKASYYSRRATGARTASGERLHHDSLTCAHRSYPFGTVLRVTNLNNKREVLVRVTDRGPYGRGRVIDLSYGAARELGMLAQGVAPVKVEFVSSKGTPYRIDDDALPKIEFDMAEAAYSFIDDWNERIETGKAEQEYEYAVKARESAKQLKSAAKGAHGNTPASKTAPGAKTSAQQHPAFQQHSAAQQHQAGKNTATKKAAPEKNKKDETSGNIWSNVFEKLKNW